LIKRTDANHKSIIDSLRKIPMVSVTSTHTIGKGFPDIVIGYKKQNYLVEIKDGNKSPSQRKLTPDEIDFHDKWNGQIMIAENIGDILKLLKIKL